jgi:heat shock protein HtpX
MPSRRDAFERTVPLHPGPVTVRACSGPPLGSTQNVVRHGFAATVRCSRTLWWGRATTNPRAPAAAVVPATMQLWAGRSVEAPAVEAPLSASGTTTSSPTIHGMKRRSYGRDAGLTLRMIFTSGLLGLLYVIFAAVLITYLNVGVAPMIVIVVGLAFFQYFTSDKLALAAAGAKVVSREEQPALHDTVERLCAMADLPKPKVAIMDTPVPNAFATGRSPKHAAVCVTTGLLDRLEPKEVEGVLAHELSHIANRDVLIMTLASFFAMLAALLTRFGLYFGMWGGGGGGNRDNNNGPPVWLIIFAVSIVVYAVSFILIRTISRYREYAADRGSALITGSPEYLMSALQKISSQMTLIPNRDLRQVEGMSAFFIMPAKVKSAASELFMDHPPLEKRLAALAEIAREMGRPVA